MAALGQELPTMLDFAKSMNPDGTPAAVVELLAKSVDLMEDIPWMEGNLSTGHRITQRTALPSPTVRRFNEGYTRTKGAKVQFDEACAMYGDYCEVDMDMVELFGSAGQAYRASEEAAHIEGFGQAVCNDYFFGNSATAPGKFNGFATRYNDLNYGESSSTAKDGGVIDGGGSGSDNTSIWLICWGPRTVHGIYPRNMKAGLQIEDKGEQRVYDANNKPFQAYVTYFKFNLGLAVEDWRYVIRIANLDVSNLAAHSSNADLFRLMGRAVDRIPKMAGTSPRWYTNRALQSYLREQALVKSSATLTYDMVEGKPIPSVWGIPVRTVDALGVAEAALT